MDTTDPDIKFDERGICNYCNNNQKLFREIGLNDEKLKDEALKHLLSEMKKAGKGREYDCIIGLSGGVDSSYVAYLVKNMGLRPLAVHVDNGWNSELAIKNIENIVRKLGIDLYTYVIDWEEFKDLQISFLRASIVDLEMLSDNAIVVAIDRIARGEKIKYFLAGTNLATESIMPPSWFFNIKYDSLNIKSIYKRFGSGMKLKTFPLLNFFEYIRYRYFNSVKVISILNYVSYKKEEAIDILKNKLDWRDYGGKHGESKITQFYQSYILPTKYNVDKRRAFLSCLISSGQISRDEALEKVTKELYSREKLKEDKDFFLKKMGFSETVFEEIMDLKKKSHYDYPSYDYWHKKIVAFGKKIINLFSK
ncbi:hypothetical protein A2230_08225 [candidate division WOR-1 bacterium RIFOXYA2_FULL_36_21]|uniref:NAD/GMP synthase domain-containing protein n=1 Tax=candidate division WOR-1 bacterium RIFOXYB2_FULL_36_35 TaxID=1802578 RepID=A0A1F4S888_UNCSA|nr:MAG: hypothetical protein A2230_08225 [candidate division WOR-1 bacterium RIFOXYA2_FULL_36_21]OGC14627.1 MAG: hypothetical protein A2282_04240 [candidate division WOR-1 bacterium RIFOXYA12_FULL_36_13]OGC16642.1 MAG: hypothetical protein A2290_03440 [candidate division WOR-1 bacterium RIFOXYB2_FULL_36_35]